MKTLAILILGIALGAGIFWFMNEGQHRSDMRQAQDQMAEGAERMKDRIQETVDGFSFNSDDIRREIEEKGTVVRQKAKEVGDAVMDATADARITTKIKGKLALERDLSVLKISVDTTDGLVTLSGSVASYEQVGKAMQLALEVEGVREVVSTLQVRQGK
jgi:osmotically-inducible protein OsmY